MSSQGEIEGAMSKSVSERMKTRSMSEKDARVVNDKAFKESVSRWCRTSNKAQKSLGVDNLNELELRRLQDVLENEFTVINTCFEELK